MIIKGLLELIYVLLQVVFAPINLPALPDKIQRVVDELTNVLSGAVGLLGLFLDMSVVIILIPLVIVIANFDKIWKGIMFILRKIPFLGMK